VNTPQPATEPAASAIRTVAVIGLGLLGGSLAKCVHNRTETPGVRVIGWARRSETRQFAIENDIVDAVSDDVIEACELADLAVIATPVDRIADYAIQIAAACPGILITDVGSTKLRIVEAVNQTPAAQRFVAAHPIAGSEKTGIEHAFGELFCDKPIVITPSGNEQPGAIAAVEQFWKSTGGRTMHLTPRQHDDLLAITSHAPHLISSLVARQVPAEAIGMVGTGWLDTTRIAAGDEALWTAIVSENRTAILAALTAAQKDLTHLIHIVQDSDDESLAEFLRTARLIRQRASNG
jgi:prephenate dehydrogenase